MLLARPTQSHIKSTHPALIKCAAMCLDKGDRMYNLNLGITSVDCSHPIEMLQPEHAVSFSYPFSFGDFPWDNPKMLIFFLFNNKLPSSSPELCGLPAMERPTQNLRGELLQNNTAFSEEFLKESFPGRNHIPPFWPFNVSYRTTNPGNSGILLSLEEVQPTHWKLACWSRGCLE